MEYPFPAKDIKSFVCEPKANPRTGNPSFVRKWLQDNKERVFEKGAGKDAKVHRDVQDKVELVMTAYDGHLRFHLPDRLLKPGKETTQRAESKRPPRNTLSFLMLLFFPCRVFPLGPRTK